MKVSEHAILKMVAILLVKVHYFFFGIGGGV